jgi:hypothetical protein
MRRYLAVLVSVAAAAVLATGCGVVADDRAAVVGDEIVRTSTVDDLARDGAFVTAVFQGQAPEGDSVLSGDLARDTLLFEIQRTAARQELERLGGEVTEDERRRARTLVEAQVPGRPSDDTLEVLIGYVATNQALAARLGRLDPDSTEDLRLVYEGVPTLWDRTCVLLVRAPAASAGTLEAVTDGPTPELAPDRVEGVEVLADPDQRCIPTAQLPAELRDGIRATPAGRSGGPVVLDDPTGAVAYAWRVRERQQVGFEAARDDLTQIVQAVAGRPEDAVGQWVGLTLFDRVEVNPRYGRAGVSLTRGFQVLPPAGPLTAAPNIRVPDPAPLPAGGPAAP